MRQGFIKLMRTAEELFDTDLECYLLLSHIALKANREDTHCFKAGEVDITNYKNLSRQKLRRALKKLSDMGQITIKTTNRGTRVRLISTDLFDINIEDESIILTTNTTTEKQQLTTDQPPKIELPAIEADNSTAKKKKKELINIYKEKEKINKKEKEKFTIDLEFPSSINTPECKNKFVEWVEYKKEIKKPYKSYKSINALLKRFSTYTPDRFIESIDYSISQGYTGIWENPKKEETKNVITKSKKEGSFLDLLDKDLI